MILAGDVGGTNFRLALFRTEGPALRVAWRQTFSSRGADWLEILRRARREAGAVPVDAACVAVAGPVEGGEALLTNLGWRISAHELARELALPAASVLNDLEAAAGGLLCLEPTALATLQAGAGDGRGNRVLCSPGTGLGEAALVSDGAGWLAVASEGGHASFSPLDDEDRELAGWLAERHGHVSWERVLSGPGLVALYEFQRDVRGLEEPRELALELAREERAAVVTRAALERGTPIAVRTLERFARLLGVEAGNLALKFLARGGVYLGGGIVPRIRSFIERPGLERPCFLEGFLAKGRMRALLERLPVRIVLDPDCALLGAARHAALGERLPGARPVEAS